MATLKFTTRFQEKKRGVCIGEGEAYINFAAVAFEDFLFVLSGPLINCVFIHRPCGDCLQTPVARSSRADIGNGDRLRYPDGFSLAVCSDFFAVHRAICAIIGGGRAGDRLHIHAYDQAGLQPQPTATIHPRVAPSFVSVAFTEEMLITVEGAWGCLGEKTEVVLRSRIQPHAPPLHVLFFEEDCDTYFRLFACGTQLAEKMRDLQAIEQGTVTKVTISTQTDPFLGARSKQTE